LHRDGGTLSISESGFEFCIDNRISTETKYRLYLGYPSKNNVVTKESDFNKFLEMISDASVKDQLGSEQKLMIEKSIDTYDEYKRKSEMRHIYKKFINGDYLTDEEVDQGIVFFKDITKMLDCLGKEFRLQGNETRRVRDSFISYREARDRADSRHLLDKHLSNRW